MAEKQKTVEELFAEQETLQTAHDKAQKSFHSARSKYAKAKEALTQFNGRYGRMLTLAAQAAAAQASAAEEPTVEEEAAAAADKEAEVVEITPDDVGTVDVADTTEE